MNSSRIRAAAQIKIYIGKCFRVFINEKQWKSFISAFVISLLLVVVMSDGTFKTAPDTQFSMFAMICGCIWVGVFNSIQSVCKERGIIKHEHHTGLRISSYIFAHAIYELVVCAVEALIMTLVLMIAKGGFGLEGVVTSFIFAELYFTFVLIVFAADMLGLLVSCIVKTSNAAMTIMPFILIVQLIFGGVMFQLGKAEQVKYFTISHWGVDALCSSTRTSEMESAFAIDDVNISEEEIDLLETQLGIPRSVIYRYSGLEFQCYEPTAGHLFECWFVLMLQSAIFIGLGILFLGRVKYDKR